MCDIRHLILFGHARTLVLHSEADEAFVDLAGNRNPTAMVGGQIGLDGIGGRLGGDPSQIVKAIAVQRLDGVRRRRHNHANHGNQIDARRYVDLDQTGLSQPLVT